MRRHNQIQKAPWHSTWLQSISNPSFPWNGLLRAVQKWRPILLQQYLPDPSVELLPGSSLCWCCRSFGHLLVPHTQWTNPYGAGHKIKRAILVEENTSCLSGFEVKRRGMSLRKSAGTTCTYDPVCIYGPYIMPWSWSWPTCTCFKLPPTGPVAALFWAKHPAIWRRNLLKLLPTISPRSNTNFFQDSLRKESSFQRAFPKIWAFPKAEAKGVHLHTNLKQ